jgi:hypothetical protein
MELPPTDFEFPENIVNRSKISEIERNFGNPQVHTAEQLSKIERKQAKLVSVPERVPEYSANWLPHFRFSATNNSPSIR